MSFNPRQPPYTGYDFGFGQMLSEEQLKYIHSMQLWHFQNCMRQSPYGIMGNYQQTPAQMNRNIPHQQPYPLTHGYGFYNKPQFEFGNSPVYQVPINQSQNMVRRLQKAPRSNAVIVISDSEQNEPPQTQEKEPSPVTQFRRHREECLKTVKIRKEKQIKKTHESNAKSLQQRKKPRKKIEYLNKGERKSNRQIKLKNVQSNNEEPQERHRQEPVGKSRVGNQFQTEIPSLFSDIIEKQLWVTQKKKNLFKRHLN